MSLGLGDLKKKKPATTSARVVKSVDLEPSLATEAAMNERHPAGAWAGTQAARPWSATALNTATRPSKGHKKQEVSDIAMNEEAASLLAAPLFYLEVSGDSRLARVEETLVKIEERVTRALEGPMKAAQLFFPKFFAQ